MDTYVLLCTILIFIVFVLFIYKRNCYIKENSICIRAVCELNKSYGFKDIKTYKTFKIYCKNKSQFDNFNIDKQMILYIEDNFEDYTFLIEAINYNRAVYEKYKREYSTLLKKEQSKSNYRRMISNFPISIESFKNIELNMCNKIKASPAVDFRLKVFVCYTSAKGKNSYKKSYLFDFQELNKFMLACKKIRHNKQSAAYQRQLMSPKLRYEIMKRDNFKCVICGRSQKDGALLHIDHILPVSKGGKTEKNNLRTLCDLCNLGKGNSYNPNGIN